MTLPVMKPTTVQQCLNCGKVTEPATGTCPKCHDAGTNVRTFPGIVMAG